MKRLTVIQTLPALDAGGVERGTLEIARALVAAGHRSIVVSNGGRLVTQLEREGSEHITLPVHRKSLGSLFQVLPFRRLLQDIQPDVLHARSRVPAWIAWLAWRKLPVTARPHFVTTVHGLYSVSPYSAIMVRGERVIAVSETVRDYILKNYPQCPPENIELIYRGVDPVEFPWGYVPDTGWTEKWRQDFPQLHGRKILTLPGRITRLKGHETFIRLVQALRAEGREVHGLIVGGAEEKKKEYLEEIRNLVTREGLDRDITLTGHRRDMREIYAVSDVVYSLSTKPETFGRTTLEALCLGTPVLGWDKGGVGEILRHRFPLGAIDDDAFDDLLAATRHTLDNNPVPAESNSFRLDTMQAQTLALYAALAENS